MNGSEKTGFLPTVPFEGQHPEMLIEQYAPAKTESTGNSEYSLNNECWD